MTMQEDAAEVAYRQERVRRDSPALQAFDAALDNLKRGEPMIPNSKRRDFLVGFSPAGTRVLVLYVKSCKEWRRVGVLAERAAERNDDERNRRWDSQLDKAYEADAEVRDALRGLK